RPLRPLRCVPGGPGSDQGPAPGRDLRHRAAALAISVLPNEPEKSTGLVASAAAHDKGPGVWGPATSRRARRGAFILAHARVQLVHHGRGFRYGDEAVLLLLGHGGAPAHAVDAEAGQC